MLIPNLDRGSFQPDSPLKCCRSDGSKYPTSSIRSEGLTKLGVNGERRIMIKNLKRKKGICPKQISQTNRRWDPSRGGGEKLLLGSISRSQISGHSDSQESDNIFKGRKKKRFLPFHETYRIVTIAMVISLLFPNPKYDGKRFALLMFVYLTLTPLAVITVIDMYDCVVTMDLVNLTRHCAVIVPFSVFNIKMTLMYIKRKGCKEIIDEISSDYERLNCMSKDYMSIANDKISASKFFEKYWMLMVFACVLSYPITAFIQMLYSYCFHEVPVRYMAHDTKKPFSAPEERLQTPFFEFMFIYTMYSEIFYLSNFIGYDGFFGLAVHHACLKMNIYCRTLEKAFQHVDDMVFVKKQIAAVIKEQCHTFRFVDKIQNVLNAWLGLIFTATVVQICTCMFQIIEGNEIDMRYLIFFPASIVHIYLPCRNASVMKDMSEETAVSIYFCGWEHITDLSIRKTIMFMMARAQRPLEITAFNVFTFDMELFVSILRTAYSMFTLLRS